MDIFISTLFKLMFKLVQTQRKPIGDLQKIKVYLCLNLRIIISIELTGYHDIFLS